MNHAILLLLPALGLAAAPETPFRNVFFEPNRGQAPAEARFVARARGTTLSFTTDGASMGPVQLRFAGAQGPARWEARELEPSTTAYLLGNDRSRWLSGVPHYRQLAWRAVYPGIDAVFYGTEGRLEYDLIAAPGADLGRIRLRFDGASAVTAAPDGALRIRAGGIAFDMRPPRIYQLAASGAEVAVQGRYRLLAGGEVRFEVGDYDRSRPLVLDPVLQFTSYYGGEKDDSVVAVTSAGDVVGTTRSLSFGTSQMRQGRDIFALVANPTSPTTRTLVILGGSGDDVATCASPNYSSLVIGGWTDSPDFGTPGPAGGTDGIVITIDRAYTYSGYWQRIGGSGDDHIDAVHSSTNGIFFAGDTTSPDLQVNGQPLATAYSGGTDVFYGRGNGNTIYQMDYFGGPGEDRALAVARDDTGGWIVGGRTTSDGLPLKDPWQAARAGASDGLLFRVYQQKDSSLAMSFATYFGGSGEDEIRALSFVSATGTTPTTIGRPNPTLTAAGVTTSTDLALVNASQPAFGGGPSDAFIARWNATSWQTVYVTYLGGSGRDEANALTTNSLGDDIVAGATTSTNLPVANAFQPRLAGPEDAWIAQISGAGKLQTLTYFGGSGADRALAASATAGNVVTIGGETTSQDLAMPAVNSRPSVPGGGQDGFEAALALPRFFSEQLEPLTVARGMRTMRNIYLGSGWQPTARVTVTSSDPSRVALLAGASTQPRGSLSFALGTMAAGDSFTLYATALADDGEAEIRIEIEGAGVQTLPVRVGRRAVIALPTSSTGTLEYGQTLQLYASTGVLDSAGRLQLGGILEGSTQPVITYSVSDPAVASLDTTTYGGGVADGFTNPVKLVPQGRGEVVLSAAVSGAELYGPSSLTYRVLVPTVSLADFGVGKGLITTRTFVTDRPLNAAQYTVRYTTPTPDRICVQSGDTCEIEATNAATSGIGVRMLADSGTATINWSSSILGTGTATATVTEPKLFLSGVTVLAEQGAGWLSAGLGSTLDTTATSRLSSGKKPLVTVVSSDPEVAEVSSVSSNNDIALYGKKAGTATLVASSPGFVDSDPWAVTVKPVPATPGRLTVTPSALLLGRNQKIPLTVNYYSMAARAHVRSSAPELVTVSVDPAKAGTAEIDLAGSGLYVHGLAAQGNATLTFSAEGVADVVVAVRLAPSGFAWKSAAVACPAFSTLGLIAPLYSLDPDSLSPVTEGTAVPGVTAQPTLVNDVPQAGSLKGMVFTAAASGEGSVSLTQPEGFTEPAQRRTAKIVITPRTLSINLPGYLGKNVQVPFTASSQSGKALTIRSEDPSRLVFSLDPKQAGTAQVQAASSSTRIWAQGLADEGIANVRISGEGVADTLQPVTLTRAVVALYVNSSARSLSTTTLAGDITLSLGLLIDPWGLNGTREASLIPGAGSLEVTLRSSEPGVAQLATTTATIQEGVATPVAVTIHPTGPGETRIGLSAPEAFQPGAGLDPFTVRVTRPIFAVQPVTVGRHQTADLKAQVGSASVPLPITVTLTSTDPSRVLVAASPSGPCQEQLEWTLSYYSGVPRVCGVAEGSAGIRISSPGFDDLIGAVTVVPPTVWLGGAGKAYVGGTNAVSLGTMQPMRAGARLRMSLTSSDPSIATVPSLVTLEAGTSSQQVPLTALREGSVIIRIVDDGFASASTLTKRLDVVLPPIDTSLPGVQVGKGLVGRAEFFYTGSPTTLTVTSADPARLLLSLDGQGAGQESVSLEAKSYTYLRFWAHARTDSGKVLLRYSAPGYESTTAVAELLPAVLRFSQTTQSTTVSSGFNFSVAITCLNQSGNYPSSTNYTPAALSFRVNSSNPAVGTLDADTLTIAAGQNSVQGKFTPTAKGTTTLTLTPPAGVVTTETFSQMVITVN